MLLLFIVKGFNWKDNIEGKIWNYVYNFIFNYNWFF